MRVVVHERHKVADLLAGGPLEGSAGELVDPKLCAVARAVLALRTVREAPTDEALCALARDQGVAITGEECEELRREGGLRRAA